MKRQLPPTSLRYCAFCKNETTFKYNRNIGHSCCKECGWHYIPTLDPNGLYEKEIQEFLKAREEKRATKEYQDKKAQHEITKQKQKLYQILAYSKERNLNNKYANGSKWRN
jgi:hypothetical protein